MDEKLEAEGEVAVGDQADDPVVLQPLDHHPVRVRVAAGERQAWVGLSRRVQGVKRPPRALGPVVPQR
ncbi:hypothetical protein ACFQ1S_03410 [Kibdelosporangium lantanae]|uniref:Uncharacterized protein n=1 Tax=Kibdelosporangium lantanae TaxID=1497396 RepID=A0ABW3M200_9PSEU